MIVIFIVTALRTSSLTKCSLIFLVIHTLLLWNLILFCCCGVSETGDSFPSIFFSFTPLFMAYICVCIWFFTYWGRSSTSTQNVCMLIIYSCNFIGPCHSHALKAKYVTDYVFFLSVAQTYNLGEPSASRDADPGCSTEVARAVSFGINTNFLVAIIVCIAILLSKCLSEIVLLHGLVC